MNEKEKQARRFGELEERIHHLEVALYLLADSKLAFADFYLDNHVDTYEGESVRATAVQFCESFRNHAGKTVDQGCE